MFLLKIQQQQQNEPSVVDSAAYSVYCFVCSCFCSYRLAFVHLFVCCLIVFSSFFLFFSCLFAFICLFALLQVNIEAVMLLFLLIILLN